MASANAFGITGYGGYVPRLRMERAAIAAAHKWMAPALRSLGKGQRAFCSWDEDSVTMAVEAARDAFGERPVDGVGRLLFASTTMPFSDMQNAAIVRGALSLREDARTLDIAHSQRAGTTALLEALSSDAPDATLVIASDRPRGKPASTQEITFGAGAAAFTVGRDGVLATLLGSASSSAVFVDHFRSADNKYDYFWEERWIRDEGYMKIVPPVVASALDKAGVKAGDIKHFVMASPFRGVVAGLAKKLGLQAGVEADALDGTCGYSGSAHALLMLAHTLEKAQPGELILVVGFGQGCDALVLRASDAVAGFKPRRGVSGALADGQSHDAYLRMLSYDEGVELEWGMRAEKQLKTALTEQYRSRDQLAGFVAGRCRACGTVQFPQLAYCVTPSCNAPRAQFDPVSLIDVPAKVLTYTADWLSYHPSPPLYVGFAQFDNGARMLMEMVDVGAAGLEVGTPLRVTYRIKDVDKARGYPRYFWKATPLQA
ncbi:MAG TPA: 3-oxoacyl-[acyl-carrier-protein] synthase III C-terminal domain-containing protein [Ramlibacter sp.]|nr:3-oxoacyl-[acyl-carrier-protein] synthase III C-terminal domain-containing protein [Ramlibacter sp.]